MMIVAIIAAMINIREEKKKTFCFQIDWIRLLFEFVGAMTSLWAQKSHDLL